MQLIGLGGRTGRDRYLTMEAPSGFEPLYGVLQTPA